MINPHVGLPSMINGVRVVFEEGDLAEGPILVLFKGVVSVWQKPSRRRTLRAKIYDELLGEQKRIYNQCGDVLVRHPFSSFHAFFLKGIPLLII